MSAATAINGSTPSTEERPTDSSLAATATVELPLEDIGESTRRVGLVIEPVDAFFCRDGRPFGEGSVVLGGLPQPQVIAGALRTHALRQLRAPFAEQPSVRPRDSSAEATAKATDVFERWKNQLAGIGAAWVLNMRCRGPWLCAVPAGGDRGPSDVFVPMPANVVHPKDDPDRLMALRPRDIEQHPLPGWPGDEGLTPFWHEGTEELKGAAGFLGREALAQYLAGGDPTERKKPEELFGYEYRTCIAVESDRLAAAEGMIYSTRMVRLERGVGLYVEIDLRDDVSAEGVEAAFPPGGWVIQLGGEGKLARVRPVERWAWPRGGGTGQPQSLLLTTPAAFPAPYWRPTFPAGVKLRAAAVPGSVAISGWDLALRCPKPTRHFVQAGAVYLLDPGGADLAAGPDEAATLATASDADAGYGVCLKGAWTYG